MAMVIPRNIYPLPPVAYAEYSQAVTRGPRPALVPRGRIPLWTMYYEEGDYPRVALALLARVRPDIEVVLVSPFVDFELDPLNTAQGHYDKMHALASSIDRALASRVSKSHWAQRNWWISHLVYIAQPGKRKAETARPKRTARRRSLCAGVVSTTKGTQYHLGYIPLSHLKINIEPSRGDEPIDDCDVGLYVDLSKRERQHVRDFLVSLSHLERWEQAIVHRGLGHLLGSTYVNALNEACRTLCSIAHADRHNQAEDDEVTMQHWASILKDACEGFRPVQWLKHRNDDEGAPLEKLWLCMSRFPPARVARTPIRPDVPHETQAELRPLLDIRPMLKISNRLELSPNRLKGRIDFLFHHSPIADGYHP